MSAPHPPFAIHADRVFDGARFHGPASVAVVGGLIRSLNSGPPPKALPAISLPPGALLAPGFIDVQVNGGGGVLLNDDPSVEAIARIAAAHRRFGTTALLPTLISDSRERMRDAIGAVADAIRTGVPGVVGIHLEGPFLNPARTGIHPPEHLVTPGPEDVDLLASLGEIGVTLVTLAPERVPPGLIAALTRRDVRVCAGHTDGTAQALLSAIDEGLTGFTHLYNAMSQLGSREPGAVGVALADAHTFAGIIADGHHVADLSLRVALRAKGAARLMLVTDAMSTVGTDMRSFTLFGRPITVVDGRCTAADGTLAGAALDMATAVRHMIARGGASLEEALRMASATPAAFLGLTDRMGAIRPGLRADLVALDPNLHVIDTWIGGRATADDRPSA